MIPSILRQTASAFAITLLVGVASPTLAAPHQANEAASTRSSTPDQLQGAEMTLPATDVLIAHETLPHRMRFLIPRIHPDLQCDKRERPMMAC